MIFDSRLLLIGSLMVMITVGLGEKTFNACNWIQCVNGGTCEKLLNSTIGYQCRCPFGFTGLLCENRLNITICGKKSCLNQGICTMTKTGSVQCQCSRDYTGVHCETLI